MTKSAQSSVAALPNAPLWRQLVAMLYDSFLIIALLLLASIPMVILNHGEAVSQNNFIRLYFLLVIFIFYSWFWHKSGQTLGMKVWKIRIIDDYGRNPSWQSGFLRLFFALLSIACLGLGYWWQWFTGYTWHDKLSQTRVIMQAQSDKTDKS